LEKLREAGCVVKTMDNAVMILSLIHVENFLKMLVGILVPTSGIVTVNGIVPHKNRVENAKRIGDVFGQKTQLW